MNETSCPVTVLRSQAVTLSSKAEPADSAVKADSERDLSCALGVLVPFGESQYTTLVLNVFGVAEGEFRRQYGLADLDHICGCFLPLYFSQGLSC